jgi:hypothetical protein
MEHMIDNWADYKQRSSSFSEDMLDAAEVLGILDEYMKVLETHGKSVIKEVGKAWLIP